MHNNFDSPIKPKIPRHKRIFLSIASKFSTVFGQDYSQPKFRTEIVSAEKRDSDLLGDNDIDNDHDDIELNEETSNERFVSVIQLDS